MIFKFVNVFSLYCNHLPLEIGGALHFNNLIYIPFIQGWFVPNFIEISPIVLVFSLFRNCLPLEKGGVLHLKNLNNIHSRLAQWFWKRRFFKFVKGGVLHLKNLNNIHSRLAQWFWKRRFFKFVNVFSQYRNYLPLIQGGALLLNKFESPTPKDDLCQVWLKLAQ